ncbi:hypothetical protein C0993_004701 [Termitomyces sp. T159_Od127]|nr:hypothetical protein C0993_004701 [Termitomyces sp. T159_Od127]
MSTTQDHTPQSDIGKMKTEADGSYKRADASFRNTIEKGGRFEPELAVSVVSPRMGTQGWPFANVDAFPDSDVDPLYKAAHVKDLYLKADSQYNGRFTVPVLWDRKTHTIVNNESSEIIRIFNTAFNHLIPPEKAALDYYPTDLRSEIDDLNAWIYPNINNGVYRAGFATTQEAYQKAVVEVFEALDRVEKLLAGKDYLVGGRLTEADIRLWVTIVCSFTRYLAVSAVSCHPTRRASKRLVTLSRFQIRFDPVYVGHFKCNLRTVRDGYPAIHKCVPPLTSPMHA